MIRSGRKVPTPAMPMPDFAVPYAAPMPVRIRYVPMSAELFPVSSRSGPPRSSLHPIVIPGLGKKFRHIHPKIMAAAIPACSKDRPLAAASPGLARVIETSRVRTHHADERRELGGQLIVR